MNKKLLLACSLAGLLVAVTYSLAQADKPSASNSTGIEKVIEQNEQILQKQDEISKKLDELSRDIAQIRRRTS